MTAQWCAGGGAEVSNLQSATSVQLPGPPVVKENINPKTLLALVKVLICLSQGSHPWFSEAPYVCRFRGLIEWQCTSYGICSHFPDHIG